MFPTPEDELRAKIKEECFQEQFKIIHEISKDIRNRLKNLFYSLIQAGISIKILKEVLLKNEILNEEDFQIVDFVDKLVNKVLEIKKDKEKS